MTSEGNLSNGKEKDVSVKNQANNLTTSQLAIALEKRSANIWKTVSFMLSGVLVVLTILLYSTWNVKEIQPYILKVDNAGNVNDFIQANGSEFVDYNELIRESIVMSYIVRRESYNFHTILATDEFMKLYSTSKVYSSWLDYVNNEANGIIHALKEGFVINVDVKFINAINIPEDMYAKYQANSRTLFAYEVQYSQNIIPVSGAKNEADEQVLEQKAIIYVLREDTIPEGTPKHNLLINPYNVTVVEFSKSVIGNRVSGNG